MNKKITIGIIAHVDSGKTTLSEALLYASGKLRSFGRVDKGESFLDNDSIERRRGITIYSKPALFEYGGTTFTLLDTPGHADFSAEMERTLQVLDYAVLVVSASDGVTGRCEALWRLLSDYGIPVFIFVNKMDQPGSDRLKLMAEIRTRLSDNAVSMDGWYGNPAEESMVGSSDSNNDHYTRRISSAHNKETSDISDYYDSVAMCSEAAMEEFLESGAVSDDLAADMIADRQMFPVFFGSALKMQGVEGLLHGLDALTLESDYPEAFGARVFKILKNAQGERLTFMKITGGSLKVRDTLPDGSESVKISQLRMYSGERYTSVNEAFAGDICAAIGLSESFAGQGFGLEEGRILPVLSPVLSYRAVLPSGLDPVKALPMFRQLEEENPELQIGWDEEHGDISVMVMGDVQLEILEEAFRSRFGSEITFDHGEVIYKESIAAPVIGVGHFEPLRHYAEVHLLLEPLKEGSGLIFESHVSTDVLELNWQRLVLTHLSERTHRGVLTGSAITDMRITLIAGKASRKHTSGGDFRQATYRAVRQGLMMAENILLEPYLRFVLRVPAESAGHAMTDLERMKAAFTAPEIAEGICVLRGRVPASAISGYTREVAAYTRGEGELSLTPDGYGRCHKPEEVIMEKGYDPLSDIRNPQDSVFCSGGEGYTVPYDKVYESAHVPVAMIRKVAIQSDDPDNSGEHAAECSYKLIMPENSAGGGASAGHTTHDNSTRLYYAMGTEEVDRIVAGTTGANSGARSGRKGWKRRRKTSGGFGAANASEAYELSAAKGAPLHGSANVRSVTSGLRSFAGSGNKQTHGAANIFPAEKADYLVVDGYNVIFAWDELAELARANLDAARISLQEILCNWQAVSGSEVIVVYDAYRVKGHDTEYSDYLNIHVVFTKEAETADQYIERFAHDHGRKDKVAVVTSDGLEQIIIRGAGCALISSREFRTLIDYKLD